MDEATIKHITPYIEPKLFVFTNIFRDQMDRFGEIYTTYQFMLDGAAFAPSVTILANGDAPIFNSDELPNLRLYFGFNHTEDSEMMDYPFFRKIFFEGFYGVFVSSRRFEISIIFTKTSSYEQEIIPYYHITPFYMGCV